MTSGVLAPDAVRPLPGSAAATVAWRVAGQLQVTVIAKATFSFAIDAPMRRTRPQEIVRAEVHHGNNPGRSVRLTSDLAPFLSRTDVLFTGHAHAPRGQRVRVLPVRIVILDGQRSVFDKRLLIEDAAGFERKAIVYENATTGIDGRENPFGTTGEPSVVDPAQPDRPGGFGPIARAWPVRKRLLGGTPRQVLDGPIAEIPEGFDWSYFQAAPTDQRTGYLAGDEWILLEGLHPDAPLFRTRLAGARGRAWIHGLSAFGVSEASPLELRADTLRIDGDEQCCTVVWRGSFPVANLDALAAVRVVAGVEVAGETSVPDDATAQIVLAKASHGGGASPTLAPSDTLALGPQEGALPDPSPALPFRPGLGEGPSYPLAGPPAPREPTGTLALGPEDAARWNTDPALPFVGSTGAKPAPFRETLLLSPEADEEASRRPALAFRPGAPAVPAPVDRLPAKLPPAKPHVLDEPTEVLDPTPSGTVAPPATVLPFASLRGDENDESETATVRVRLVDPLPPLPPPQPPAPPPAPPREVAAPAPQTGSFHDGAASDPIPPARREPAAPAPAPPAPAPTPAAASNTWKQGLYGRFGNKR